MPSWQKSSYSSGNGSSNCVEVATGPDGVIHFRESDRPTDVALADRPTWGHFLAHLKQNP
ncbi:DUF397 domain-containing protein [Streptomyces sp. NPDC050636]|uniref:DUF397 domain-containing protein n=1 Tax=Streptomyces sp. NPDC050636 TaxID=3154510 RepID=UPI003426E526